jgi:hypothetical protein
MQDYYKNFYQTLIFNVATISAIVVGVFQYSVRAFNENNGKEMVLKVMQTVLAFVDTIVSQLQVQLNDDVPVVKVAQKTTKRR